VHLAGEFGLPYAGEMPGEMLVALVFVDLASFTSLAETMGDLKAVEIIDRFSAVVREAARRWSGRIVKQIGDAFMLVFLDPRSAVACALEIEGATQREPSFPAVRSGVHWAPALFQDGDYVGASVNLTARIAAAAERHQVLVTAAVRRAAAGLPDVDFVRSGRKRLKGISDEVEVFAARSRAHPPLARLVDPVCGMELSPGEVAVRLSLDGVERVFCSDACLRRFVAAPEHFR
jgi:class 3 adenylate cyclase